MRQVAELVRLAAGYLSQRGSSSPRLDAELLLAHTLGMSRLDVYVQFDRPVDSREVDRFRELIRRRGAGEPVAYLIGEREFRGNSFEVNRSVLIPRPETELLVEAVLSTLASTGSDDGLIVDVGTGSGIIAVSLALERSDLRLAAVDVSADALAVARRNARRHGVEDRITWMEGDLLEPVRGTGEPVRGIVSNPPYVTSGEWAGLEPTVRDFEPRIALDGGPEGMDVITRLIRQSAAFLDPEGFLAMEVGAGQRDAVTDALEGVGFESVVWQEDWAGHPRVVVARPAAETGASSRGVAAAGGGGRP